MLIEREFNVNSGFSYFRSLEWYTVLRMLQVNLVQYVSSIFLGLAFTDDLFG